MCTFYIWCLTYSRQHPHATQIPRFLTRRMHRNQYVQHFNNTCGTCTPLDSKFKSEQCRANRGDGRLSNITLKILSWIGTGNPKATERAADDWRLASDLMRPNHRGNLIWSTPGCPSSFRSMLQTDWAVAALLLTCHATEGKRCIYRLAAMADLPLPEPISPRLSPCCLLRRTRSLIVFLS